MRCDPSYKGLTLELTTNVERGGVRRQFFPNIIVGSDARRRKPSYITFRLRSGCDPSYKGLTLSIPQNI